MARMPKGLLHLVLLLMRPCVWGDPIRQSTTFPATRGSRAPHSQHRRQVLSSNTPDPNAYYAMTTPQAGDGNCLYAMMGVNGADPYPVRFESCTPLQDTALWQCVSDTKGSFFISNKGWPGYRMEINDYHETIIYMNVANDSLLLQHWSINSINGGFEIINGNHPGYPMCSMSLDNGYVALILYNTTAPDSYTANWKLVKNGLFSSATFDSNNSTNTSATQSAALPTATNSSSLTSSTFTTLIVSSTPCYSSTSNLNDNSTNTTRKQLLNSGDIAGIIIGVIGGIALLAFLALRYWVRRQPNRKWKDLLILSKCRKPGGFKQRVRIYKRDDPTKYMVGNVLIDSGNEGPNLITTSAMEFTGAIPEEPSGSSTTVIALSGAEVPLGAEVVITFSGDMDQPTREPYTKKFCYVEKIDWVGEDSLDMVLNE